MRVEAQFAARLAKAAIVRTRRRRRIFRRPRWPLAHAHTEQISLHGNFSERRQARIKQFAHGCVAFPAGREPVRVVPRQSYAEGIHGGRFEQRSYDRLAAGELALGVILRQARTVDIAPVMKACGYDWLFLDLEHNSMDLDMAVQISVAALGVGIAPIARVPARQLWMATRVLDGGALGIVMPHVDTPEEAKAVAAALRYPPLGHRSIAGGLPHLNYEKHPLGETCAAINAAIMVIVMLETPLAISNAEAIAAVPGIDSLLIGTNDLAMELGIPGGFGDERIVAAYQAVVDACCKHGKHAGVGGISDKALLKRYIEMGVRLVLPGSDLAFMQTAASATAATMRGFLWISSFRHSGRSS